MASDPRDFAKRRRLYGVDKGAPIVACLAIVVLALRTRLWWVEAVAGLFLAVIVLGVCVTVRRQYPGLKSPGDEVSSS